MNLEETINKLPALDLLGKTTFTRVGAFHHRYVPAIQEAIESNPHAPELIQYARDLFATAEKLGWELTNSEARWFNEHVNLTVA